MRKPSAREKILDTAESLFAQSGIEAVSLREINRIAGYSIAALHYHFTTRDGLVDALLERTQPGILARRTEMVEALRKAPVVTVRALVEALVYPLAGPILRDPKLGLLHLRFISRLYFDRTDYIEDVETSMAMFRPLLRRALPKMDPNTLEQRWLLAAELTVQALANSVNLNRKSGKGLQKINDYLEELITFLVGALQGPTSRARSKAPVKSRARRKR